MTDNTYGGAVKDRAHIEGLLETTISKDLYSRLLIIQADTSMRYLPVFD
ncbi:MAG: hypothetical protein J5582_11990 [Ruminococcus sp.]|nr:hypothetical protein [Ruminococcus sp.]